MLNGRNISTKEIVLKVLRDNGYQVQDFSYSDVIEWIAECIDLIGCPFSLTRTVALIKIKDYRGLLPCNFHSLIQASAFECKTGIQFPMRGATNTFHPLLFKNPFGNVGIINIADPVGKDEDGNPIFNFNNYESAINKDLVANTFPTFQDITYDLNDNYIFTSFKDGANVLMSYRAFPIDEEGFPMIPDNQKFREATAAFVRYKIDYKLWRRGKLEKSVFDFSEREKDWYIGAATTSGLTPTVDQMESWKNQAVRLIPRMNEHANMFQSLGDQERLTFGKRFYNFY